MDAEAFRGRVAQIWAQLDAYTYYELLKVPQTASPDQIRASFHRMALTMHPDRYHQHADGNLRDQLYAIYKRLTEAYRVLMSDAERRRYDDGLLAGKRRLEQTSRPRQGPKAVDEGIDNPQAKKFFKLAQDAERRGDTKGARLNYGLALNMLGQHALIEERLAALKDPT